jgi:hypothetical protein
MLRESLAGFGATMTWAAEDKVGRMSWPDFSREFGGGCVDISGGWVAGCTEVRCGTGNVFEIPPAAVGRDSAGRLHPNARRYAGAEIQLRVCPRYARLGTAHHRRTSF